MLTELDLSCDEMKRTEAKMKIKMIDWKGNIIGVEGVRMISEALKCNNCSLTELNLCRDEMKEQWQK